jgi:lipopolysaccharide/colanic/teichoic acid biosynthesis glycosyltransferase
VAIPQPPRTPSRTFLAFKRVFDVVGALLLLAGVTPVMAIALVAVRVDSGAPLIYRRRVVGRGGRAFDAYKIRTMMPDADALLMRDDRLRRATTASRKLQDDPRVTSTGRWLRRSSLDELPQLVNVLRGEMSLVGPRMLTAEELGAWGPIGDLVLTVRPGITGIWQVSGRQNLSREERIRLDKDYVQHMSVALDISILARTLPAVLSGRGAM